MNKIVSSCAKCGNPIYEIQNGNVVNIGPYQYPTTAMPLTEPNVIPYILRTCQCSFAGISISSSPQSIAPLASTEDSKKVLETLEEFSKRIKELEDTVKSYQDFIKSITITKAQKDKFLSEPPEIKLLND